MNQHIYYVYAYLREDNTPYYIGKGKGKRAWSYNHNLNIPVDKSRIVFLETNLSDIGALALERRMIRWYGRKDQGTGILQNRTDGGEGAAGRKMSAESKSKISEKNKGKILGSHSEETNEKRRIAMLGKNKGRQLGPSWNKGIPMRDETKERLSISRTGKTHSEETRIRISAGIKAAHDRKKPVETPLGVFHDISDALLAHDVSRGTFNNYIWKNPEKYRWIK
jgi:hypothetical protein